MSPPGQRCQLCAGCWAVLDTAGHCRVGQGAEHFHAVSGMAGTGSTDGEALGTHMAMVAAQAYRTRLEVS